MPVRQHLGALGERQFRLLYAGQLVSVLGDGLLGVTLAFAVLGISDSASDLGLVLAAKSVPMVAFLLVGGVLADRLPRRAVLLGSDLVRAGVQALLAVLLLTGQAEIWQLVVLQAVYGLATAAFYPAWTALMPAVVSPANLQSANGWYAMTCAAGMGRWAGHRRHPARDGRPGLGDSDRRGTFAVSAFLALMRVPPRIPAPRRSFLVELREGWTGFVRRTWVLGHGCRILRRFRPVLDLCGARAAGQRASSRTRTVGGDGSGLRSGRGGQWRGRAAAAPGATTPGRVRDVPCVFVRTSLALAAGLPVPLLVVARFLAGVGLLIFNTLYETMLQRHPGGSARPGHLVRLVRLAGRGARWVRTGRAAGGPGRGERGAVDRRARGADRAGLDHREPECARWARSRPTPIRRGRIPTARCQPVASVSHEPFRTRNRWKPGHRAGDRARVRRRRRPGCDHVPDRRATGRSARSQGRRH
jgi:hypothetical protein